MEDRRNFMRSIIKLVVISVGMRVAWGWWKSGLATMRFAQPVKSLGVTTAVLAVGLTFLIGLWIWKTMSGWKIRRLMIAGKIILVVLGLAIVVSEKENFRFAVTGRRYIPIPKGFPTPDPRNTPVVVRVQTDDPDLEYKITAAGDVACPVWYANRENECKDRETAKLLLIENKVPDAILLLGDAQYPSGKLEDFAGFDRYWGQYKVQIYPVPGNHDYETPGAVG